jgi:serpin B
MINTLARTLLVASLLLPRIILAQQAQVVAGNNAFAFDLYGKLKATPGNIFFSPYSISSALTMTYTGARGNTEKQMAVVMHFDQKSFHPAFGYLQKRLNDVEAKGDVTLSIANGLWMQNDYKFLPDFVELAQKNYRVELQTVDFKHETEKSRLAVNTWVADKTNGKITYLLPPGSVSQLTRLILVNAIYFKGTWFSKFDSALTETASFWTTKKDSIKVKMMATKDFKLKDDYRYMEDTILQALEMPYRGKELSMLVVLPKRIDGLHDLEQSISSAWLDSIISNLSQEKVRVRFPKFRATNDFLLGKTLRSMGIIDAFDSTAADFSGMTGNRFLHISEVIHKAFVDVNEEGTEAAAATAVAMAAGCAIRPHEPPMFRANHPFLFFIRDNRSGSILFMGKIVHPLT